MPVGSNVCLALLCVMSQPGVLCDGCRSSVITLLTRLSYNKNSRDVFYRRDIVGKLEQVSSGTGVLSTQ